MKLIPLGVSNRFFYYMSGSRNAAFDIHFSFDFKERLDRELLKSAVRQALANFSEFAVTPVLREGTVWAIENEAEPPLLEEGGKPGLLYGTEDTNGYLFAFHCRERGFCFSYFHGLTDFHGIWSFFRTILYYYAQGRGLEAEADEWVRESPRALVAEDEAERLDPYRRFAPAGGEAPRESLSPSFALPEDFYSWEDPRVFGYALDCPLEPFLRQVKAHGSSAAAFLALLISRAMTGIYDTGGETIRTMLSADMRRYYGARTMANFSDATYLTYDKSIAALPMEEQGRRMRQEMKGQLKKEHFDGLLVQKLQAMQGFENSGAGVEEMSARLGAPLPKEVRLPLTIALTYPGSLDLPPAYGSLVERITRPFIGVRGGANILGLSATSWQGTLNIVSSQRFDSPGLMEKMQGELREIGVEGKLRPLEHRQCNQVLLESLQRI